MRTAKRCYIGIWLSMSLIGASMTWALHAGAAEPEIRKPEAENSNTTETNKIREPDSARKHNTGLEAREPEVPTKGTRGIVYDDCHDNPNVPGCDLKK